MTKHEAIAQARMGKLGTQDFIDGLANLGFKVVPNYELELPEDGCILVTEGLSEEQKKMLHDTNDKWINCMKRENEEASKAEASMDAAVKEFDEAFGATPVDDVDMISVGMEYRLECLDRAIKFMPDVDPKTVVEAAQKFYDFVCDNDDGEEV